MKNFEEVVNSKEKVLVKFGADWCGPCKIMDARLKQLTDDGYDNIHKVDIEEFQSLGTKFVIKNLPTIIIFQNGEVVDRFSGFVSVTELKEKLK